MKKIKTVSKAVYLLAAKDCSDLMEENAQLREALLAIYRTNSWTTAVEIAWAALEASRCSLSLRREGRAK